MSDPSQQDMDAILDVMKAQQREQLVLSQLLEKLRIQTSHHFVLHVRMGDVSSYLTSVTLEWVTNKVRFAADLPIFRESREGSKRIQVDPETVEQLQQRQPDWRRQLQMAAYLATRRHHKFPPLLLVGYQRWVYEDRHDRWGTDARAMDDSLTLRGLEPTGTYWDLDDTETEFYALDGQHRLMAILGLRDLIQNGQLHALDQERNPKKGGGLSREDIVEHIHKGTGESHADIHERLQHLMDERIGIEIVPAVRVGETYSEALRRLRQMFVDVNENAKVLSRSELAQLDETNGYRIVSRRLLAKHPLLKSGTTADGQQRPKVDTNKTTLPEGSNCYTTLDALAKMVRLYLKENRTLAESSHYASWGDNLVAKGVFIRPEDVALEQGEQAMDEYFHHLATIPSHVAFIQGKPASELRKSEDGEDNILFRPMVQAALAEAIGKLVSRGVSLKNVVEELGRQEQRGQLKLTQRTGPWFGVLCDISGKMRRQKKNEELCCRLFQYLLGGGIVDDFDREKLRDEFAAERRPDPERDLAINLDGKSVPTAEILLPNPWR